MSFHISVSVRVVSKDDEIQRQICEAVMIASTLVLSVSLFCVIFLAVCEGEYALPVRLYTTLAATRITHF